MDKIFLRFREISQKENDQYFMDKLSQILMIGELGTSEMYGLKGLITYVLKEQPFDSKSTLQI